VKVIYYRNRIRSEEEERSEELNTQFFEWWEPEYWHTFIISPLVEDGYSPDYLESICIFKLYSLHRSQSNKKELEVSLKWYGDTESEIHRESRESKKVGDKHVRPNEAQIKRNEENLRKKYYRLEFKEKLDTKTEEKQAYQRIFDFRKKMRERNKDEKNKTNN